MTNTPLGTNNNEIEDEDLDTGVMGEFVIYNKDSKRRIEYPKITETEAPPEPEPQPEIDNTSILDMITATDIVALDIWAGQEEEITVINNQAESQYPIRMNKLDEDFNQVDMATIPIGGQHTMVTTPDTLIFLQTEGEY